MTKRSRACSIRPGAEGITCAITCGQSHDDFMATPKRGSVDLILSDIALAALEALLQKKSWS
jgi:hypothetical protein